MFAIKEQSGDVQQLLKSLREFLRNIEDGDEAACVLAGLVVRQRHATQVQSVTTSSNIEWAFTKWCHD